jgi:FlgD Ig-like domain
VFHVQFIRADWLVSVTDTNGAIVRTITGSTTDGIIQTSWDGTDDNNVPLPVENLYQITVDVNETSSFSALATASLATTVNAASVLTKMSSQGVPEFTVQKSAPNPLTAYQETLKLYKKLTPQEKLIYPPLPTKPANNPNATTTTKMSAREMFLALHKTTGISSSAALNSPTPNATAPLRSGSTKDLVWWENSWSSGKTLLAYAGDLVFPQSGYVSSAMVGIRNLINTAGHDLDLGGKRDVYDNRFYSVSSASDFSALTNRLAETSPNNVRAFYFYGHGNTNGNAFGTQTRGVFARPLAVQLGNYIVPSATGRPTLVTHHAYSFVFLDGCNTGLGDFPEAFGIPKAVTGAIINGTAAQLHKRAFMGWGAKVTHTPFFNYELEWSSKFWNAWLDNGNDSTVLLKKAVDDAEAYHPGVTNDFKLQIYGNKDLTWGE